MSAPRKGRGKAAKSLQLVEEAYGILGEIQPASVRAVCYRLFVAGLIPDMSKGSTAKVSVQLTWAREQGIIPWSWIVDETREAERVHSWDDPAEFARAAVSQYRRDRWSQQGKLVEVWSEKGTMRGMLQPVLHEYGVTFRVLHGFSSATAAFEVAKMIEAERRSVTIFYLGDWDPSGLYMSEVDLPRRLAEYGAAPDQFTRLALTEYDVTYTAIPWFPASAKAQDRRYRWFVQNYGDRCWELDAFSPVALRDRLAEAIEAEIEPHAWNRCAVAERAEVESLRNFMGAWSRLKGANPA